MSKDVILQVKNLSKQYRLGLVGTGTLSHDLNRWWHTIRGKENPYLRVGESNDRSTKGTTDYVWALRDINFEVKKGEVLGIIGKNGAGKSTLLKILSKVTGPTIGTIKTKGRIASLLEVGTGFHPELTGRENIYLNGAILGMTKKEISSKIDEIVEFSGCQRYIDTPTKRYSSGMTVRLAFAVAAHLEPEILIIDEVLAVGDAEFQKKAIGKMQDISQGEGRTVLFVSHNMAAVEALCSRVIILKDGLFYSEGKPSEVINDYLQLNTSSSQRILDFESMKEKKGNEHIQILSAAVENASSSNREDILDVSSKINVKLKVRNTTKEDLIRVGFDLKNLKGEIIFGSGGKFNCLVGEKTELTCHIPDNLLNDDTYQIHIYINNKNMVGLYSEAELLTFQVKDVKRESGYLGKVNGVVRPKLKWTLNTY